MTGDVERHGSRQQRLQIVASGETAQAALAAALARSLALLTGQVSDVDGDLPARAVPLRASGPHLVDAARLLIEALLDEIATSVHQICAVRLDGLLHREDGVRVWGYAYIDEAASGTGSQGWIEDLTVDETGAGSVEIRTSIVVSALPEH